MSYFFVHRLSKANVMSCRWLALAALLFPMVVTAEDIAPITWVVPDKGVALSDQDHQRLTSNVKDLQALVQQRVAGKPLAPDVEIYVKALDLAMRFGEFYDIKKDVPKADWAIKQAQERLEKFDRHPWTNQTGLVVRGYRSQIDGSAQPYGMVIPEKIDLAKPAPLYVWLHGRGSKETDLHFIHKRATSVGEVHPDDTLVVHAFGRQCIGFKGPGEQDVIDVIAEVQRQYRIDSERIVLMGFSMGGGGARSVGCHYTDLFCAIHAGAGYSETALFMQYKPEALPPKMEQTLWRVNDVPYYVRNLFCLPYSEYSGDQDKQTQASVVMKAVFAEHGKTLPHFIGPMTAHKYHPDSLKEILALVKEAVVAGRPKHQPTLSFQTQTLRYNRLFWLEALGLDQHWNDSRIDAKADGANVSLTTVNINRLRVNWSQLKNGSIITLDGNSVTVKKLEAAGAELVKQNGTWDLAKAGDDVGLRKRPGQQGPIDDIFNVPFMVVEPSGKSPNATFERWSSFEAKHFRNRWASAMRGDLRVKKDTEVTDDDMKRFHLVLWGDATSNVIIGKMAKQLPISWDVKAISVGGKTFTANEHALAMIYPNPLNPTNYVVINSALTWREFNDRNNSLQNPKLGDWAIIGLDQPPTNDVPGRIVVTDFFDERWAVKP